MLFAKSILLLGAVASSVLALSGSNVHEQGMMVVSSSYFCSDNQAD